MTKVDQQTTTERFEADLASICLDEGRMAGSAGHAKVVEFLEGRLKQLDLVPYRGSSFRIPYERNERSFTNLVGTLPGSDRALPPVLIGAHFDSVIATQCADDNAAAVCIALEAALALQAQSPKRDIVIALFDAEEPPYFLSESMGSIRFFEDHRDDRGFHAALILDLVGHDVSIPLPGGEALGDILFVTGSESHPDMASIVRPRVARDNLRVVASLNRYVGDMSDHHVFRANDVPFLFLSCGRWEHYHEPTDTIDRLNLDKMARIAAWLAEAATEATEASFESEIPDDDFTLTLECESIGAALSSLDPAVLEGLGLKLPTNRAQMNRVAHALISAGL